MRNKYISAIIVIIFFGISYGTIIGIQSLEKDFQVSWTLRDSSYIKTYLKWEKDYFQSEWSVHVNYYFKEMDYYGSRNELDQFHKEIVAINATEEFMHSWYKAFSEEPGFNDIESEYDFYMKLSDFTETNGYQFRNQIKWKNKFQPYRGIESSKIVGMMSYENCAESSRTRYQCMVDLREKTDEILSDQAFPYCYTFFFAEEYATIDKLLWTNLYFSITTVSVVTILILGFSRSTACVILSIAMTIFAIIGYASHWGVTISVVFVLIGSLISIGLAVDYSVHIGASFSDKIGNSGSRMTQALCETGPAVFNGIISTVIAVSCIALIKTYIFRIFFRLFFLVTFCGGAHALIFLPCLLNLFGGEKSLKQKISSEEKSITEVLEVDLGSDNKVNLDIKCCKDDEQKYKMGNDLIITNE